MRCIFAWERLSIVGSTVDVLRVGHRRARDNGLPRSLKERMRLDRSELFLDAVEDRLDLECSRTDGTRCAAPRAALRSNEAARLRCLRCRPAAGHQRQRQTHSGSVNAMPVAGPASDSCYQNLCAGAKLQKKTGGPATLLNSRRSAAVQNERWQAMRAVTEDGASDRLGAIRVQLFGGRFRSG